MFSTEVLKPKGVFAVKNGAVSVSEGLRSLRAGTSASEHRIMHQMELQNTPKPPPSRGNKKHYFIYQNIIL